MRSASRFTPSPVRPVPGPRGPGIGTWVRRLAVAAAAAAILPLVLGAHSAGERWVYPVGPPGGPVSVIRGFDPPAKPWLPGHRGVDLRAPTGSEVRSAASGTVTYAGPLAGRGVVVVQHAGLRTTYEPVDAEVAVAEQVSAGEPLGTLAETGSHCSPDSCLHWGAIRGNRYVDPLHLVGSGEGRDVRVRLLPLRDRALSEESPPPATGPPGRLRWPVAEPFVTSPFGMRVHPITGERRLHDGIDLRAACGAPIRAAARGRISTAGARGPYGLQVTVDHGSLAGVAMTTSYSHLSRVHVAPGDIADAGEILGLAGTTGLSTGCHLHFMVYADGSLADPIDWLPSG